MEFGKELEDAYRFVSDDDREPGDRAHVLLVDERTPDAVGIVIGQAADIRDVFGRAGCEDPAGNTHADGERHAGVAAHQPVEMCAVVHVPYPGGDERAVGVGEQRMPDRPAGLPAHLVDGGLQRVRDRGGSTVGGHRDHLQQLEKSVAPLEFRLDGGRGSRRGRAWWRGRRYQSSGCGLGYLCHDSERFTGRPLGRIRLSCAVRFRLFVTERFVGGGR